MFTPADPGSSGGARRKPTAIVIGAGFGGLAAAIRLGARGYRRHRAGAARRAGRARLRPPAGRLHLRRRPDHRHRAVPVRGALAPLRPPHARRCRTARRWIRSTRSASPTARPSPIRADRDAMRAEVERFSPGEAEHFDAFLEMSEAIYRIGFEQLGDVPVRFDPRHGAHRAGPAAAARLSQRLRPGVALLPRRTAAHGVQLSSAADRRQSVQRVVDLLSDRLSRKDVRRPLADRRHRRAGARARAS